ncbi:MAG: hypothetical protein KGN16_08135 [Burkholderiales bacterium]|nr:hypothetical protein [Burkholderiales bacterium]
MGPIQALGHVVNLFLPALMLGALASGLAKLVWRRELARVSWAHLAGPACAACAAVSLAGLIVFGHDGRMATYAAMVIVCAVMLWWRGFR